MSVSSLRDQYLILIIGTCEMNIIFECTYYPREYSKVDALGGRWQRGGRASNICTVLGRLDAPVEFLGMLTNAPTYQFLNDDFTTYGIRIDNCPQATVFPPFSSIVLSKRYGTSTITKSPEKYPPLSHQHFLGAVNYRLYKWMHFEAKNPEETLRMLIDVHAYNRRSGDRIITSVELTKDDRANVAMAELGDYVFVNDEYLWEMCWQNLREACYSIRDILRPRRELQGRRQNIICNNGLKGSACLDANGRYTEFESFKPKTIVESLGASDAFAASVIYALAEEKTRKLHEAVHFGVQVEGLKLTMKNFDGLTEIGKTPGLNNFKCADKEK